MARIVLMSGKGGVGKTTIAAATGLSHPVAEELTIRHSFLSLHRRMR
jgi:MinD superfamily P-loop ATPase